jgi:1-aminocyclopropane-1-carboxylate deaminase
VDSFTIDGKPLYVKRDDLIDPRYSGNKLRKLYTLLQTPSNRYDTIVSYGGIQSNAMLSIAYLAKAKGWRFEYWCKKIPAWLKKGPVGNYKTALQLGMIIRETDNQAFYEKIESLHQNINDRTLFVPQGGADPLAEEGVKVAAMEIASWAQTRGLKELTVVTPSGTGTTALYLRKHLPATIDVVTVPVIADAKALKMQWSKLLPHHESLPRILDSIGPWPFAKPNPTFYEIWKKLREAGIVFDLLYAPKTWLELLRAYDRLQSPILYLHSGGVSGNASQIEKYRYRGLI